MGYDVKCNMKKIKVLDCTCRDGGYYNLWNFNIDEIMQLLLYKKQDFPSEMNAILQL